MKVNVTVQSQLKNKPQTLVVFAAKKSSASKDDKKKSKKANDLVVYTSNNEIKERAQKAQADGYFDGKPNEHFLLRDVNIDGYQNLIVAGLGAEKDLTPEHFRRCAATVFKGLKSIKTPTVGIFYSAKMPKSIGSTDALAQALTEGILLTDYSFDEFKPDKKAAHTLKDLTFVIENKAIENAFKTGFDAAEIICENVNFAKWLGDMPGNRMTPTILANETKKAAEGTKLKVTVWDKARIKKENMGNLLGVSLGSDQEPKFIIMEYNGGAKTAKPICYVGKGLTFDSGGISIKPSAAMEEMKYDMCGGAAVIATMLTIAKLKLKVNAIAYVPSTENMPGPGANKPGDITTARNGKTTEVNNTDAEGRLILSDALVYASEQKPAFIVDAATLTGAMVISLGDLHTGYFTRDEKMVKRVEAAATAAGERIWHMPLVDEHCDDMKGAYGDLTNISYNKGAGSAHGAAYLEFFVDKSIPWVHFDTAGTAWNTGNRYPYCPSKGSSGTIIRTFIELAKAANK